MTDLSLPRPDKSKLPVSNAVGPEVGKKVRDDYCNHAEYMHDRLRRFCLHSLIILILTPALAWSTDQKNRFLIPGQRVVFLGDSNTYAGEFIALMEMALRNQLPDMRFELLNLGLPSETCCGLSEPDHPFPRPDVHERLERVLSATNPDVVFACYGMNDGIYHPFDQQRFERYQHGMNQLIKIVKSRQARLVLITPPPFDSLPMSKQGKLRPAAADSFSWFAIYDNYDQVMQRYSGWILAQAKRVNLVIDARTPILNELQRRRLQQPDFSMSKDGIHINREGHRILANTLLAACGYAITEDLSDDRYALFLRKHYILRDSWLTHTRHTRPGIKDGLSPKAAADAITEIEIQIAPPVQ